MNHMTQTYIINNIPIFITKNVKNEYKKYYKNSIP